MVTLEEQFAKEVKRRRGKTVRALQKAFSREYKEDPVLMVIATVITIAAVAIMLGLLIFRR
jgi:hypothetical protein